jgi:hypothetical protein
LEPGDKDYVAPEPSYSLGEPEEPTESATSSSVTTSTSEPVPAPEPPTSIKPAAITAPSVDSEPGIPPRVGDAPSEINTVRPIAVVVPAPMAKPTTVLGLTFSPGADGGLNSDVLAKTKEIAAETKFSGTILGFRENAVDREGHPIGKGVDFVVGRNSALGDAVAKYIMDRQGSLGVKYIIWDQQYNDGSGPRDMDDRGSNTANHKDHVHVTFK